MKPDSDLLWNSIARIPAEDQELGKLGGEDAELFKGILDDLLANKKLSKEGVQYDPYSIEDLKGKY